MQGLHVNSFVSQINKAIDTNERHYVFNLKLYLQQAFFTDLLDPCGVKLLIPDLFGESIMLENHPIQIILIRMTFLLLKKIKIAQCAKKFCDIMKVDVDLQRKVIHILQVYIFPGFMVLIWSWDRGVNRYLHYPTCGHLQG